jgi:hypothetical protein
MSSRLGCCVRWETYHFVESDIQGLSDIVRLSTSRCYRGSRDQELTTSKKEQLQLSGSSYPRHHRRRWTWAISSRDAITSMPAATTASFENSALPLSRFNVTPKNAIVTRRNSHPAISINTWPKDTQFTSSLTRE